MHGEDYQLKWIYKLSAALTAKLHTLAGRYNGDTLKLWVALSHIVEVCPLLNHLMFLKENGGQYQAKALKGIIQLCLWKEPGVHGRRGVSFESDEEFRSDLQLWFS